MCSQFDTWCAPLIEFQSIWSCNIYHGMESGKFGDLFAMNSISRRLSQYRLPYLQDAVSLKQICYIIMARSRIDMFY